MPSGFPLSVAIACCLAGPAVAQAGVEREIIVKHAPLSAEQRGDVRDRAGVSFEHRLPLPRVEVVAVDRASARPGALSRLRADPSVVWAEANGVVSALTTDARWNELWGLENTGQTGGTSGADVSAPEAWSYTKGAGVTVAVVDTGVQLDHPDLEALAGNPGERGGGRETDEVDNDGNGYVDDWRGWNWILNTNVPFDEFGHGTHVAGTVAAVENAIGVVGVAPQARIMSLRVLNRNGFGGDDELAAGFAYAGDLGIRVVNASLGGLGRSFAVEEAIATHPNTLYVTAAGNAGARNGGVYPCTYAEDNVICVAASTALDTPWTLTNYGSPTVDLFAPGLDILSLSLESGYRLRQGTSMAAPHVAGAAALLFAAVPGLTVAQAKAALLDSVDKPPFLDGYTVSNGRLNAAAALAAAGATSPLTTTIALAPAAPNGGDGWYRTAVGVKATPATPSETRCAADPGAVPHAFAELPPGPCLPSVSGDGAHVVYAASGTGAGAAGPVASKTFRIDASPPSTITRPTGLGGTIGWYTGPVSPDLSAGDGEGSGVADTRCALDPAVKPASSAVLVGECPATITGDGAHRLYFSSTDVAGNHEPPRLLAVKIDASPPSLTAPDVTVDATRPEGALLGAYPSVKSSDPQSPTTHRCVPAAPSQFAIGATTVWCRATNAAGLNTDGTFTVKVRSADEQLAALARSNGYAGALARTVQRLLTLRPPAGKIAACAVLSAATHLPAPTFVADVTRIRAVLGCRPAGRVPSD